MAEMTYHAPDIECDGCAESIRRALGRRSGIQAVEVDVPARRVRVAFDEGATSDAAIRERLESAGFPAEPAAQ